MRRRAHAAPESAEDAARLRGDDRQRRSSSGRGGALLQLQRLAGNQATTRLLEGIPSGVHRAVRASPSVVVQRSPGLYDQGGLDVQVSLEGTTVTWFFPPDKLSEDMKAFLSEDTSRVDTIETAIDAALQDEDGALHESSVYLESPPVSERLRRDLLDWPSTGTLPQFAGWLARRAAARKATNFLYPIEQALEAAGTAPGSIDWGRELQALRANPPLESETVIDASMLDRYDLVLSILSRETASHVGDPSAPLHTDVLVTVIRDAYVDPIEPPPEMSEEFVRTHSEAFLESWLPAIEEARFVPEDFDLEALRPPSDDALDDERDILIQEYLDGPARSVMQLYLLDRWAGDPLSRSTESYLAGIALEALRDDLLDHLADDFIRWAGSDSSYRATLWDATARQTAFDGVAAMVAAGHAAEAYNAGLGTRFATVGPEDLEDEEWAIANEPAAYAEATVAAAASTRDLLTGLSPDLGLELSLSEWYQRAFETLPGTEAEQAPVVGGLAALFRGFMNLRALVESEQAAARAQLREGLDVGYDDIADVIREQSTFADHFIENEWVPMLKQVALEQVTANKEDLEAVLDSSYPEQAAAKYRICVHVLDDMIEKLESGDYESLELDGEIITADNIESLWVAREFCLGQAEALEDPDKAEETRDELQGAIAGFETVRANIESGEYEPIDYASAVYEEARARLGLAWYDEYTTMHAAISRWEVVEENPFLAYAIASWQWEEHVRKVEQTAAVFAALGMLTVASFVFPGAAGLVIGGIDMALGLAAGIAAIDDAYDLLALARLDPDGTVRGITVQQAEEALSTAWLGLGLTTALTLGIGALFGRLIVRGRSAAAMPSELVRINALMRLDPVAAERILSRVRDAYAAEKLLELAGDSRLLQQSLDSTVARGLRKVDTWGNARTLDDHFLRHGADFGARSADDYARQASEFLEYSQANRLPTKIGPDGVIRTYDPSTNTFAAYNADGTTKTFFKPRSGQSYWYRQPGSAPWGP